MLNSGEAAERGGLRKEGGGGAWMCEVGIAQ